ncbi:hypothetical protein GGE12_001902 [Rhizobium mongolense]|uniref:Uncharacterized protein n=1 Tax=Rhizobium mongolense TaxID=57676 RepID=A0A7W6WD99_9HYPH|nr:hypothetical protein [Rhizobium mongolense]
MNFRLHALNAKFCAGRVCSRKRADRISGGQPFKPCHSGVRHDKDSCSLVFARGHIKTIAYAVAEGAKSAGAEAAVKRLPKLVPEEVAKSTSNAIRKLLLQPSTNCRLRCDYRRRGHPLRKPRNTRARTSQRSRRSSGKTLSDQMVEKARLIAAPLLGRQAGLSCNSVDFNRSSSHARPKPPATRETAGL